MSRTETNCKHCHRVLTLPGATIHPWCAPDAPQRVERVQCPTCRRWMRGLTEDGVCGWCARASTGAPRVVAGNDHAGNVVIATAHKRLMRGVPSVPGLKALARSAPAGSNH